LGLVSAVNELSDSGIAFYEFRILSTNIGNRMARSSVINANSKLIRSPLFWNAGAFKFIKAERNNSRANSMNDLIGRENLTLLSKNLTSFKRDLSPSSLANCFSRKREAKRMTIASITKKVKSRDRMKLELS